MRDPPRVCGRRRETTEPTGSAAGLAIRRRFCEQATPVPAAWQPPTSRKPRRAPSRQSPRRLSMLPA